MRGPTDNERYPGQPDPDIVSPTEIIPPGSTEFAAAFLPMDDEALAAEMRGLVENAATQSDIEGRIVVLEDGPLTLRLLRVGAATANRHEEAAREDPLAEQHTAGFYYMQGAMDHYKVVEFLRNRRVLLPLVKTINEIGAEVYRQVEEAESS